MAVDTLGGGEYEVYFKSRGGEYFTCRARNLIGLSWSRRLNEISEASVTIALNGTDPECCACIGSIDPWKHELAIFRNGVEVWVGPVVSGSINLETQVAKFEAKDLSVWFDKRWIELRDNDTEFEEAKISDVYKWLMLHAYARQPWNMTWDIPDTEIPIDRIYTCAEPDERWSGSFQSVGNELRDLAKSGIDFTVIRRHYQGGNIAESTEVQQILTDEHWATLPSIQIAGNTMATEFGVGGGNGGYFGWYDDQIWIERGGAEAEEYGLLQMFSSAPELDEEETTSLPNAIAQQAYAMRELKKAPFVFIKGGSLSPKAPLAVDALVPGSVYRILLTQTCRTIESDYRLYAVQADLSASGETISLELTPLGADALR